MDSLSLQLFSCAKRTFALITIFTLVLINWVTAWEFELIDNEEFLDMLCRYGNDLGDYMISSQWPILSLVCYLSSINDFVYLRRRLLSKRVDFVSRCGWTCGACIVFTLVCIYKWFWLTIGVGIPQLTYHTGIFQPDFATNAIIMMTACFSCFVAGVCEMKWIYLQLNLDAKKKRISREATTAV